MNPMTLDIDHNALLQLVRLSGGGTLVNGVMERFFVDAPKRVDEMRNGLGAGDRSLAKRGAHSLKSTAGFLGLRGLVTLAKDFESQAADGAPETLDVLLREIESTLKATREQLPGTVASLVRANGSSGA